MLYRGIAKCYLGDGSTISFWEDLWTNEVLATKFPSLFSFASCPSISAKEVAQLEDLDSIFHLPPSMEFSDELLEL